MKAAQVTKYGGQDVVQVVDIEQPKPAAGQVLIEVYAAAINPWDIAVREGVMGDGLKLPATLGGDSAGVITAVGEGVTGFTIGQPVYGGADGSFAEFTVAKHNKMYAKPAQLDFEHAAALALVGCAAIQALTENIKLQPGQKILIHGGAGGIGSMAIQIAKHIGAQVVTTASTNNMEFVKGLGADEVIDYTQQDFSTLAKDYDAVFDTVGGETNIKSYQVLKPGGILVSMVSLADDALVAQYNIRYIHQFSESTAERLKLLSDLVEASKLKVNVDKVFPLAQAAEALEYLKTGHPKGKVVIRVRV